jgi:hypothetical protein
MIDNFFSLKVDLPLARLELVRFLLYAQEQQPVTRDLTYNTSNLLLSFSTVSLRAP